MPEERPPDPAEEPPSNFFDASVLDEFVPQVADLLNRFLSLGAAMTRTMVRASAPGEGGAGDGALDEVVRNGSTAVANLVRMTIDSLRASTQAPVTPGQAAADPRSAGRPAVRAGDTLRMPLFIENPSAEPSGPLRFGALDADSPAGTGRPLVPAQVRCNPETLEIGARDFEKLTVFVDTEPATTPGRHRVRLGVPETAFVTTIEFDVLARL